MDPALVKKSKRLSKVLRHDPGSVGLVLDEGGWVEVDNLLAAIPSLTLSELRTIVAENDKRRFSFDPTERRIRANQGHSVDVDLGLAPSVPPEHLFHGTSEGAVPSILERGIERMSRQHVHLSADRTTATRVGSRHGKPRVLVVHARRMHEAGHTFYLSDNGVWLTERVPRDFVSAG